MRTTGYNIQKAGRFLMRDDEGPAKNLLLRRTKKRPARHYGPLLVFRSQEQKSIFKLGRFSSSFAEITDVKIMEPGFRWLRNRFPKHNLHPATEKIKPHIRDLDKLFQRRLARLKVCRNKWFSLENQRAPYA